MPSHLSSGAIADLERFVSAQASHFDTALAELRDGQKRSHWIWYIFPQLRALGRSATAQHYGLRDETEAASYWNHPVLGPRLRECIDAMLLVNGRSAVAVLGEIDALKFRSCLTLFQRVAPTDPGISAALTRFFAGEPDQATLQLLQRQPGEV